MSFCFMSNIAMVNSALDYFLHSFISIYGCHYCGFQPWIGESRSFVTATTTASLCRQRNAAKRNITVCYCVIDPSAELLNLNFRPSSTMLSLSVTLSVFRVLIGKQIQTNGLPHSTVY